MKHENLNQQHTDHHFWEKPLEDYSDCRHRKSPIEVTTPDGTKLLTSCPIELAAYTPSQVMTHKYRGCIVILSINKSVKPNKEQKVLTIGFDQGFTVNTSKRVFRGIW
jgi:hypothetical protein